MQEEQLKEGQYIYDKIFKPLSKKSELKIKSVKEFEELSEELKIIWGIVENNLLYEMNQLNHDRQIDFIHKLFCQEKGNKIMSAIRSTNVDQCIKNEDNLELFLFEKIAKELNLEGSDLFVLLSFISIDVSKIRIGIENKKRFDQKIGELLEKAEEDGFLEKAKFNGDVICLVLGVKECKD